jgi:hypothetical protein
VGASSIYPTDPIGVVIEPTGSTLLALLRIILNVSEEPSAFTFRESGENGDYMFWRKEESGLGP